MIYYTLINPINVNVSTTGKPACRPSVIGPYEAEPAPAPGGTDADADVDAPAAAADGLTLFVPSEEAVALADDITTNMCRSMNQHWSAGSEEEIAHKLNQAGDRRSLRRLPTWRNL
jgi:hypothetical protein